MSGRPESLTGARKVAAVASGMSVRPHEFELIFKAFPDPRGQQTYFSLNDMKLVVEEELFRRQDVK